MRARDEVPGKEELRGWIAAGTCWWCGKGPFRRIAGHTEYMHGISTRDLREMLEVTTDARICSEEFSEDARRRLRSRIERGEWKRGQRHTVGRRTRALAKAQVRNGEVSRAMVKEMRELLRVWEGEKPRAAEVTCACCGEVFRRKQKHQVYCSRSCAMKAMYRRQHPRVMQVHKRRGEGKGGLKSVAESKLQGIVCLGD